MHTVKILSIDGGGIRGIIPALILAEIERRIGDNAANLFDLIAGTSTGGLIALGLTIGENKPIYHAGEIAQLYKVHGKTIFSASSSHFMYSANGMFREKYTDDGFIKVTNRFFGNYRLKDCLTDVIITSYDLKDRVPFFFKSSRAKTDPIYDYPVSIVARATSAAPTYFKPVKLVTEGNTHILVDGGLHSNNPAMCGYAEARRVYPDKYEYIVVSLGTGERGAVIQTESSSWGLMQWARPIMKVVLDGASDVVDYQLRQILQGYYRFQVELDEHLDVMDNTTKSNIEKLENAAFNLIRSQSSELDKVCDIIQEKDTHKPK